ncbi:class I SAM-dependent methyltransferase [Solibacillus sp. FSL H8-0538]|uniref:class I SAM-dependent methyltransferase n=1 Tax=Solibacillus sp. FSL H8-0538 TaxID=2921400 RepID=UPI0030F9757D
MNEAQFERLLNINTAGFQHGFPKLTQYHRYEPTPYEGLEQLFEQYELPEKARVIDIGCGKGRVPIYMHYRFHIPTSGIEMDQKFFFEAANNRELYLEKAKKKHLPITFLHMLAEKYEINARDNVFFFFNPFSIHIFRQVMSNILYSYEQYPREIHLIMYYPAYEYMAYLEYETAFERLVEVKLANEKNENERIVVFTLNG